MFVTDGFRVTPWAMGVVFSWGSPGIGPLEAGIWRIYWAQRRCSGPDRFNIRVFWAQTKSPKRRFPEKIRP